MLEPSFLLFRLTGPMAAWGDLTVGEWRTSWDRPSKSAVLGLLAAALGHPREAEDAHAALHAGLGFAVRVDQLVDWRARPAAVLRDYHTAQAPSSGKNKRWRTRAEEVADRHALNTILSQRWYYTGFAATVALWRRGEGPPDLDTLATALERPVFALYLGRKSCPLGAPPAPRVIAAEALMQAFQAYDTAAGSVPPIQPGGHVWTDVDPPGGLPQGASLVTETRRDTAARRKGWLFEDRTEQRFALPTQ